MKAIIIEESRFKQFLDHVALRSKIMIDENEVKKTRHTLADMSALWHYEFVKWAQKEGASCL